MNIERIRQDFPILEKRFGGKKTVYLDNAATSLTPKQVIEAENSYYLECNANIHRGLHKMSEEASRKYEQAHADAAKFVGAKMEEIVFTKNCTESINAVMYSLLSQGFFSPESEILVSRLEHHANLVPWQQAAKRTGAKLRFIELNPDYTLDMQDFEAKINKNTKLVAIAHASNTVASIQPVQEIAKIAHESGALCLVDAAQSVPHTEVNVKKIGADFLAFSVHKMLGPTGLGVLFGKKELLEKMNPFLFGGEMIHSVSYNSSEWNTLPWKFEAGTPPIAQALGLSAAIDYLKKIGLSEIQEHDRKLLEYAFEKMRAIPDIKIFNPMDSKKQGPIVLFESKHLSAHDLALALDEASNIAVRSGMHCAEPMVSSLNPKGLCRASFYLYNTKEEIDLFAETLSRLLKVFK